MKKLLPCGNVEAMVEQILGGMTDRHVVVGPLLWQPSDGTASKRWYFIVGTGDASGARFDEVMVTEDGLRYAFIAALIGHRPIVIHDVGCELEMARLCEILWPGERVSRLRRAVEAEARGALR
jgi:hypothetical protein